MGLGLCLACCSDAKQPDNGAMFPRFGITLAPSVVPMPQFGTVAVVAVPTCWEHLGNSGPEGPPRRQLLVAGGM